MSNAWKRITSSSSVRLAGLGFVAAVLEAGSDGGISQEEASRMVLYIWGVVGAWFAKTTIEDAAHKVTLPPPAPPTAGQPAKPADWKPVPPRT